MDPVDLIKGSMYKVRHVLRGKDRCRIELLRKMPVNSVCAEIGVWKGDFSNLILEITSPKELHLIDPWIFQPEYPNRMYGGKAARSQEDMDLIFQHVTEAFSKYQNVFLHRATSNEMLKDFPDEFFDWIYLDANHGYDYVLADLRQSHRKIKKGGLIAGDDYTWGLNQGFPVQRAVRQFLEEHKLVDRLSVFGSQFIISL